MLKVARLYYPAMGYEGRGMALVIYFQGCHNRCDGCQNLDLQDFNKGEEYTPEQLVIEILNLADNHFIKNNVSNVGWLDSIVLSGGEPLHQDMKELQRFLVYLRPSVGGDKSIWLYTSVIFELIPDYIKRCIDVIVDGPFDKSKMELNIKYRGSKNQRVWRKISNVCDGEMIWQDVTDKLETLDELV